MQAQVTLQAGAHKKQRREGLIVILSILFGAHHYSTAEHRAVRIQYILLVCEENASNSRRRAAFKKKRATPLKLK